VFIGFAIKLIFVAVYQQIKHVNSSDESTVSFTAALLVITTHRN